MLKVRRASNLKPLTLQPKTSLGEGGEGSVFAAGKGLAAKIYRKPSEAIQQKLTVMLADAEEALRLEPGNSYAYFYRGIARDNLKDKKGALEDFERITEIDDLSYKGQLLGRLGVLRLEKGAILEGIGDLLNSLKFMTMSSGSN